MQDYCVCFPLMWGASWNISWGSTWKNIFTLKNENKLYSVSATGSHQFSSEKPITQQMWFSWAPVIKKYCKEKVLIC